MVWAAARAVLSTHTATYNRAKNGDGRNTTFVQSCFFASPDPPANCDPYTNCYKFMSTPPAQGYLNYTWCG